MVFVDGGLAEREGAAVEPFYFHGVNVLAFAEAEMQGVGMLGTVGIAGDDLLAASVVAGMQDDSRAHG